MSNTDTNDAQGSDLQEIVGNRYPLSDFYTDMHARVRKLDVCGTVGVDEFNAMREMLMDVLTRLGELEKAAAVRDDHTVCQADIEKERQLREMARAAQYRRSCAERRSHESYVQLARQRY